MSTISMTNLQVAALHDLARAFDACGFDVTPGAHSSLEVTLYADGPDGGFLVVEAFSLSIAGTVRTRETATAA